MQPKWRTRKIPQQRVGVVFGLRIVFLREGELRAIKQQALLDRMRRGGVDEFC